jgi:hypothetical protein
VGELTGVWFNHAAFSSGSAEVRCGLVAADQLATALGRPDREQVVTSRATTATTLQAVELTNGATLANLLARAAFRLVDAPLSDEQLVNLLYGRAFARLPNSTERGLALELIQQPARKDGVEDLLWAMTMLPEFQLIY